MARASLGHGGGPPRQWLDEQHFFSMPTARHAARGGGRQTVRAFLRGKRPPRLRGSHGSLMEQQTRNVPIGRSGAPHTKLNSAFPTRA